MTFTRATLNPHGSLIDRMSRVGVVLLNLGGPERIQDVGGQPTCTRKDFRRLLLVKIRKPGGAGQFPNPDDIPKREDVLFNWWLVRHDPS